MKKMLLCRRHRPRSVCSAWLAPGAGQALQLVPSMQSATVEPWPPAYSQVGFTVHDNAKSAVSTSSFHPGT